MYLTYTKNKPFCKENENYRLMQSNCAQQTIRVADQAFKSFFGLLKLAKESKSEYKKIRMPKYRQKGGLFNYIIQGNSISIRDSYLTIPLSREYTAIRGKDRVKIKVPERLIDKKICEVKIIPMSKQNLYTSEKMQRITNKRNNRVEDNLKKAARYIINYCIENDIGTIVCGYNPDFKQKIDLGKKTNQQFVQVSFRKFRSQLKCLCERNPLRIKAILLMNSSDKLVGTGRVVNFSRIPRFKRVSVKLWEVQWRSF